jgi:hypothetical protein
VTGETWSKQSRTLSNGWLPASPLIRGATYSILILLVNMKRNLLTRSRFSMTHVEIDDTRSSYSVSHASHPGASRYFHHKCSARETGDF